jgi:hypothetical protein
MIEIPAYWGVTIIYWLVFIIIVIGRADKGDQGDGCWIFSAAWASLGLLIWIVYSIVQLVIHWNEIPQLIRFT